MGVRSKAATLWRVSLHSIRHFGPLQKTIPILLQSIFNRVRGESWRHPPRNLELTLARHRFPFRTVSLGQAANTIREAIQHYTPPAAMPEKPTILDCGGNQGISVLYFKSRHPDATVHVFEPSPDYVELLRHNVGNIPGVHVHDKAVSDRTGTVVLHTYEAPGADSLHRQDEKPTGTTKVSAVALADFLKENKISQVDLLKLDVEGAELAALKGLGKAIGKVNAIVGEIHPWIVRSSDVVEHLERHGFAVTVRTEGNALMFTALRKADPAGK